MCGGRDRLQLLDGSGGLAWKPSGLKWRDPKWFMFDWVAGEEVLVRTWRNEGPSDVGRAWSEEGWKFPSPYVAETKSGQYGVQPATAPLAPSPRRRAAKCSPADGGTSTSRLTEGQSGVREQLHLSLDLLRDCPQMELVLEIVDAH